MRTKPLQSLVIISLMILVCGCKKDNLSLIQGGWTVTESVWKETIHDQITNTVHITNNDLVLKDLDQSINLQFYQDSFSYKFIDNRNGFYTAYSGARYSINKNILTTNPPLFTSKQSCLIQKLTGKEMILYSSDTTNLAPLVVNDRWLYLSKQ